MENLNKPENSNARESNAWTLLPARVDALTAHICLLI